MKTADNKEAIIEDNDLNLDQDNHDDQNANELAENQNENQDNKNESDDEVIVLIGEESPTSEEDKEPAPEWVKELRKTQRETAKRNRELEEQVKALSGATQKVPELGPKPKLQDCDFDEELFEQKLDAWKDQERKIQTEEQRKKDETEAAKLDWQNKLRAYEKAKIELKVKNFDEIEANVIADLNKTQIGIILQGADNPALVNLAIGQSEKLRKELSSIKDPVKFAFEIAKLEPQLKLSTRNKAPQPERKVTGNASTSGTVDSHLEKLRAEAERTGDSTKVVAYKQKLRQKTG